MNNTKYTGRVYETVSALPAPKSELGAWGWMRKNLFSSYKSVILSLAAIGVLIVIVPSMLQWLLFDATFTGDTKEACDRIGACWIFIENKFWQFMYGFYPASLYWRVNLVFFLFPVFIIPLFMKRFSTKWKVIYFFSLFTIYPIFAFLFMRGLPWVTCVRGAEAGLCYVPTNKWGGLLVTVSLTYIGILASFPLGVIVSLGRSSKLKFIQKISVLYVEFWRGVPLITILFMASVVFPLFLPEGFIEFDKLLRAIVGIILFQSAYVAEVIRGGLAAIPRGQFEAADSLGLSYSKKMSYIVLPQAIRVVLPSLVGISISLVQDTTLILIIGLFDILGMVNATIADPNWLGFEAEGLVFVGAVSWLICYSMSRYSARLEARTKMGKA